MELDLGTGYYQFDDRGYDYQRCINWFPSVSETGNSKSRSRLLPTPGTTSKKTLTPNLGTGARGLYETAGGRMFGIWGDTLYEFDINLVATDRNSSLRFTRLNGRVSMSDNGTQLMIVDQGKGYILTLATNVFEQIVDADYPANANMVAFKDGYFVVSVPGTKKFYVSTLLNGLTWAEVNPDNASIVSQPDTITGVTTSNTDLILFGEKSVEHWQNTGDSLFTFERINGAQINIGCKSPWSIAKMNNSVYFLGSSSDGFGVVWRLSGYKPQRVSTKAIEEVLGSSIDTSSAIGYSYQERGYYFYVLSIPNLDRTFVYEESTGRWHERGYWNGGSDSYSRHKSSHHVFAFAKNYVSYENDDILYELDESAYSDAGNTIRRVMSTPHIDSENKRINVMSLKAEWERGTGITSGQGSDPVMIMRYSKDGGYSWSDRMFRKMGEQGRYNYEITYNRLGMGRDYVFEISVTDPVNSALYALYVDYEVLRS